MVINGVWQNGQNDPEKRLVFDKTAKTEKTANFTKIRVYLPEID